MKSAKTMVSICIMMMCVATPVIAFADGEIEPATDALVLPTVSENEETFVSADATILEKEVPDNAYSDAVTAKLYQTPELVLSENLSDKVTRVIISTPSNDQFVRARDLRMREQWELVKKNILPTIASVGFFCTFSWLTFRPH